MIDTRTLNVNTLADLAASWFTQQNLQPPPQEVLLQIAEAAKQALIRHAAAVPAAAIPIAVEACIKAYLQTTRTVTRRVPALAEDVAAEVPVAFTNLSPRPARKKPRRKKPKPRRTTGKKRRRRS